MNYLEASALTIFAVMAIGVITNWKASAVLLSRLRERHPDFYREIGEPRLFPSLDAPFAFPWSPTLASRQQIARLGDSELLRLQRVAKVSFRVVVLAFAFAIMVQLPGAWTINAGCESGHFSRICP